MTILDDRLHDGGWHFAVLPQTVDPATLRNHLAQLPRVKLGLFVDSVTESWIDFTLEGHAFSVNDQFGDYLFFVANPDAPDELLERVASHAEMLLGDLTEGRNRLDRRSLAFGYGLSAAVIGVLLLRNLNASVAALAGGGVALFAGAWWLATIALGARAPRTDRRRSTARTRSERF
jgi:hypothetical protein